MATKLNLLHLKWGQTNRLWHMAKAKYQIERKCKECGTVFMAKQLVSQFCCRRCSKRYSKRKKKEEEHQKKLSEIESTISDIRQLLSIPEAVSLYAVRKETLYRLIRLDKIPSINLSKRLIRVSRNELEMRFDKRKTALKNQENSLPKTYSLEPSDCFSIEEITEKFGISPKTVYEMIRRHGIPTRQLGRFVYAPKEEIINIIKNG